MPAAIPLKIVAGKLSQYAVADEVAALGIDARVAGPLTLGSTLATSVAVGGAATTQVDVGVGATVTDINIGGTGTTQIDLTMAAGANTINLGNTNTQVNIPGNLTVTSTAEFDGATIIGASLTLDTLDVVAGILNNLTFREAAPHDIRIEGATVLNASASTLSVTGGLGNGTGAGGTLALTGGAAPGAGAGGQVTLTGGTSATGLAGGVTLTTTRTPDATPLIAGPVLTLAQTAGANAATVSVFAGSADPQATGVVANEGSLYLRDAGATGELWIKTAAGTWTQASVAGATNLQTAYNALNTIATAGGLPVALSVSSGVQSVLTVESAAASTAPALLVTGQSTAGGSALTVKDGANTVLDINQYGSFTVTAQTDTVSGLGSAVGLTAGAAAGGSTVAGGAVGLTGGAGDGPGAGGTITLTGGTSPAGRAGGVTLTTTRTATSVGGTSGAVLTLTQAAGTAHVWVGAIDPTGVVSGALGDTFHDTTAGDLYLNTGGTTVWEKVATGTGSGTLQSDYTNGGAGGGAIVLTATGGALALSTAVAGTGGLTVTMTGLADTDAASIANGGTGDALFIDNTSTGAALVVQDNGLDVIRVNQDGAFTVTAQDNGVDGSSVSLFAGVAVAAGGGDGGSATLAAGDSDGAGIAGAVTVTAGAGGATAAGGIITVTSGAGGATSGAGGALNLTAGAATTSGAGGALGLAAGAGVAGNGGAVTIDAGDATGAGNGGVMTLTSGSAGAAAQSSGNLSILAGTHGFLTGTAAKVIIKGGERNAGAGAASVAGAVEITGGIQVGSTTGAGGGVTITGGLSIGSNGGAAQLNGGASTSGSGGGVSVNGGASSGGPLGGVVNVVGGNGFGGGAAVVIAGGAATAGTALGGNVTLNGGVGFTSGAGGSVLLTGGTSPTGLAGGIVLATARSAQNVAATATKGAVLTLTQTGTSGASVSMFAGTDIPSGGTGVAAAEGSLYLRDGAGVGTGELYVKTSSATDTDWAKVETGTGGTATLQTAYDNGTGGPASTTIAETLADGGIKIDRGTSTDTYVLSLTDTTSASNVLAVSKTAAAAGSGIAVSMATGATGSGVGVTMDAGSTGAAVLITPNGTSATSHGLNIASTAVTDVSSRLIRVVSNALLAAGQGIAVSMLSTSSGTGIAVTTASGATSKGVTIVQGAASLGGIEITQSGVVLQPSIEVVLSATGTTAAYGIEISGGGALSAAARFATTGSSSAQPTVEIQSLSGSQQALEVNRDSNGTVASFINTSTGDNVIIDSNGGGSYILSARRNTQERFGVTQAGAVHATDASNVVFFDLTSAGAIDFDPISGQNFTVDTLGAGVISLDAAAASNFSVTGANLTLSTITSGDVNITAANNAADDINFTAHGGAAIPFNSVAPDNALDAWFSPATSIVGALNKLAVGTTSASQIVQTGFDTTTNTVTNGLLGYLNATANEVAPALGTTATARSSRVFGANEGTAGSMTTAGTIESQKIEAAITIAAGDELFLSAVTAGAVTNVAPSASGSIQLTVGYARTNGTGAGGTVQMVLQIGTSTTIP